MGFSRNNASVAAMITAFHVVAAAAFVPGVRTAIRRARESSTMRPQPQLYSSNQPQQQGYDWREPGIGYDPTTGAPLDAPLGYDRDRTASSLARYGADDNGGGPAAGSSAPREGPWGPNSGGAPGFNQPQAPAQGVNQQQLQQPDGSWWDTPHGSVVPGDHHRSAAPASNNNWWEAPPRHLIQGDTRRTYETPYHNDQSHVVLETEGRPLDAEVDVWSGPDNTPTKMKVYSEDGKLRPFKAKVHTPGRNGSTLQLKNTGSFAFPMTGEVRSGQSRPQSQSQMNPVIRSGGGQMTSSPSGGGVIQQGTPQHNPANVKRIQGGAIETWTLDYSVGSVEVLITTDGYPMYATVELLGVGGHIKQVAEIYNDDGYGKPFSALVETPGDCNTIRVVNTGPMEYPMTASVSIVSLENPNARPAIVSGNGNFGGNSNPFSDRSGYRDPYSGGGSRWYE